MGSADDGIKASECDRLEEDAVFFAVAVHEKKERE